MGKEAHSLTFCFHDLRAPYLVFNPQTGKVRIVFFFSTFFVPSILIGTSNSDENGSYRLTKTSAGNNRRIKLWFHVLSQILLKYDFILFI